MFDNLSDRLNSVFRKMKGCGRLSERDVIDGLKNVRVALLEADVNYLVAKEFISNVKKRALGKEVMKSLTPGQQVIKIVNDEMTKFMGGAHQEINFGDEIPVCVMFIGLQGSGKTTTVGKFAVYLRKMGRLPYLVSVDVYRPAAIDQLKILGDQLNVDVFDSDPKMKPVDICRNAKIAVAKSKSDILLVDTAGRFHVDEILMDELVEIKRVLNPSELLLVVDGMTGQDAVNVAKNFNDRLNIGGIVLSKMDGDARGGAALSMKYVTGKPIKFIGVGEKLNALEPFHPNRMSSRILGMGDIVTMVEKAQAVMSKEKAIEIEKKFRKNKFSLEDFRDHLVQMRKMGSISDFLSMVPGIGNMKRIKNFNVDETEFVRIEAIISSMTLQERYNHSIINGSRRKRIANGSGTKVQDVNRVLKNYFQMMKMMKKLSKNKARGFNNNMLPF